MQTEYDQQSLKKKFKKPSMIPEDVCTYVYVYIMEISEYFIDAKGCMYIEQGNR